MGNEPQILPGGGEITNLPAIIGDVTRFAAQYVRMSTEHQKYSIDNQSATISEYANRHGLTIVRTYADSGRSGLTLEGRPALQQLLADVRGGDTPFKSILVFDISRWGRFQDADESAYYEFFCKEAGLQVRYCAEPFENDGTLTSSLLKHMKRLMASEYSRELSAKVFAGACRLTTLGFKQGGTPGYGLRRLLVDEHGRPKAILATGQRKSIQTDRVLLIPGPDEAVCVVREIFRLFVTERIKKTEIAFRLNKRGILTQLDRKWDSDAIHRVLTNEKYIGNIIYNRKSFKLKQRVVSNPPEMWVRGEGAVEPLVDVELFQAARRIIDAKLRHLSDEEALRRLRLCMEEHGHLSTAIMKKNKGLPSCQTYRIKFGSLKRAFELVGAKAEWTRGWSEETRIARMAVRRAVLQKVIESIENDHGHVCVHRGRGQLLVDGTFSVSVRTVKSYFSAAPAELRWSYLVPEPSDITIAVRMAKDKDTIMDYYVLPSSVIKTRNICLVKNMTRWGEYRFTSFEGLLGRLYKIQTQEFEKLQTRRACQNQ